MTVEDGALACCVVFLGPLVRSAGHVDLGRAPDARHDERPRLRPFAASVPALGAACVIQLRRHIRDDHCAGRRARALGDDPSGAPFVLAAIGLALTIAGPLLVSNLLAEPNYDELLGWDPEAMPADWEAGPRR
jgi:hypothetical protein